jgi:serine/threonine-protein kinase RsbW
MRMKIAFCLPRKAESVSVARQSLDRVLTIFGVRRDCRDEIALAVSEACSNAVRHADGDETYELAAESDDSGCVITVNDAGPGLPELSGAPMPATDALSGRGLALMRLLTDRVELQRRGEGGLSVRMFKTLRWAEGAVGRA